MKLPEYLRRVRELGCCVCGQPATMHHVHGGSAKEEGITRGGGQKTPDWFQIPLCVNHHVGNAGVDNSMGVPEWERRFGKQIDHIRWAAAQVGVDPWKMVELEQPVLPKIFKRRLPDA